jgi:hypothetical protein
MSTERPLNAAFFTVIQVVESKAVPIRDLH